MSCTSMIAYALWLCGAATVVDGDTIKLGATTVRLFGVDAEEMSEVNGPRAKDILTRTVAGQPVKCEPMARDKYGRVIARCFTATFEVNRQVIAAGGALDCGRFSDGLYRNSEPAGIRTKLSQKPYCKS